MALKFKGVDFIEYDTLLTDDERLVRDNTRKFIEENLVPIIEQCNRDGRFPKELIKPMGELGFRRTRRSRPSPPRRRSSNRDERPSGGLPAARTA